jgi:hypothetical protein
MGYSFLGRPYLPPLVVRKLLFLFYGERVAWFVGLICKTIYLAAFKAEGLRHQDFEHPLTAALPPRVSPLAVAF